MCTRCPCHPYPAMGIHWLFDTQPTPVSLSSCPSIVPRTPLTIATGDQLRHHVTVTSGDVPRAAPSSGHSILASTKASAQKTRRIIVDNPSARNSHSQHTAAQELRYCYCWSPEDAAALNAVDYAYETLMHLRMRLDGPETQAVADRLNPYSRPMQERWGPTSRRTSVGTHILSFQTRNMTLQSPITGLLHVTSVLCHPESRYRLYPREASEDHIPSPRTPLRVVKPTMDQASPQLAEQHPKNMPGS
jgi:hypothetical protein